MSEGASAAMPLVDVADRTGGPEPLARRVRDLIAHDQFEPGERIGSERGIAAALGVDRSALRAALDVLEDSGEIRRTMGRLGGVFASDGRITRQLDTIQGVPEMLRQQGLRCHTHVLKVAVAVPSPRERRLLGLTERESVIRVERRRDAGGIPLSRDAMALPARLLPGWARLDFSTSVYELLHREFGIEPVRATESIDLGAATEQDARILGIPSGAPLFRIRRLTIDATGRAIELACDLFRADRTRISAERVGQSWKRASR